MNYSDNVFFITNNGKLISTTNYSSQLVSDLSPTYITEILKKGDDFHGLPFLFGSTDDSDKLYICRNIYQWTGKTETTGKNRLGTLIVEPKATVFDKIFSLNSNVYQFVLIDNNHHIFRNTTELSEQNIFELVENKRLNTQTYKYTASSFSTSINNLQLLLITNQSISL